MSELETAPARAEGPYAAPPGTRTDAFISYSHVDRAFALSLRDALAQRGKQIWVDEREIQPAALWAPELERAVSLADSFVFVMSPASVASPECLKELAHALSLNKRILPLNLHQPDLDHVPAELASRQFVPASATRWPACASAATSPAGISTAWPPMGSVP